MRRAGLVTAVLLLTLAVAFGIWSWRSPEPPPAAVPAPPLPLPAAPPPPPPPPKDGELVVRAAPWAELVAIVDELGNLLPLPDDSTTPLRLRLPAGHYVLYLRHPRAPEEVQCETEVRPDFLALCDAKALEATAIDYFKESGWWR